MSFMAISYNVSQHQQAHFSIYLIMPQNQAERLGASSILSIKMIINLKIQIKQIPIINRWLIIRIS